MNVLSLYDGISCGMVALERANIKVDNYYAAEIDKYSIKISEANYPSIIRMGDVTKWQEWEINWGSIDLVLAGFPCQAWSMAGQQQGDKDPRGALFWTTLDIISQVKKHNPSVRFLMENVKMKKEFEQYITFHTEQALGYVEKTLINSALVSAQNRNRFYWTNFKVTQPEDKGILLKDIIEDEIIDVYPELRNDIKGGLINSEQNLKGESQTLMRSIKNGKNSDEKSNSLTACSYKGMGTNGMTNVLVCGAIRGRYIIDGKRQDHKMLTAGLTEQRLELRKDDKTNTLTTVQKDNVLVYRPIKIFDIGNGGIGNRVYSTDGKSPTLLAQSGGKAGTGSALIYRPCELLEKPTKGGHIANATDIKGNESIKRVYSVDGKAPTLTTMSGGHREPKILIDRDKSYCVDANYAKGGNPEQYFNKKRRQLVFIESDNEILYRKLTPLECERLQTMLQYIKSVEIVLCYDQVKSFVNAVEKNPKLQKLVLSAESEELKEYAILASQNMNASQASIKNTALQNADMQTQMQIKKCTKTKQNESISSVSNAGNNATCQQVKSEVDSVVQPASITITEGKITHYGKGELHQTEQSYTEQMSGKVALNLFGNEMMQSAKDVLSALEMMQTNRHSTSITSFRLSTKNLEQILTISYWFAKDAIDGFTYGTTKTKTLYLHLIDGYTAHVSNTQRYKAIGNGWSVDVIAHILRGAF